MPMGRAIDGQALSHVKNSSEASTLYPALGTSVSGTLLTRRPTAY